MQSLMKTQRQKYIQIQKCGFGRGVICGYNALHNLHESWTLNLNRMVSRTQEWMKTSQANMSLADMDREQQQGSVKTRWIGLRCKSQNKNLSNCIASTSGKSKRPLYMEQTLCNSCILGTMSLPHVYLYICIFINIFVYLYIFIFVYLYISIYSIFSLWGSVLLSCRGARRVHDTVPRPSGNFLHQVFLTFKLIFQI